MAVRHYVITVPTPAAPVCLNTVLADTYKDERMAAEIHLQYLSGTALFIGGDAATVSSTSYAWKQVSTSTPIVVCGPVKLADLFVTGTAGDKLAIGVVDV